MGQRGRKSGSELSVVAGAIIGRPAAPESLSDFATELWNGVIRGEPDGAFKTLSNQRLLTEYCRHVESAEHLGALVREIQDTPREERGPNHINEYGKALKLRDVEVRALANLATKLRITNQSRYTPLSAATASRNASEERPWSAVA